MKVFVHHHRHIVTTQLQQFAKRQIRNALAKMARRVVRVDFFVRDVNGPRGGVDQLVHVVIQLAGYGRVFAQDRHRALSTALTNVAQKARRAVRGILRRKRLWPIRHQRRLAKVAMQERRPAVASSLA
jgi:hypothetical protein